MIYVTNESRAPKQMSDRRSQVDTCQVLSSDHWNNLFHRIFQMSVLIDPSTAIRYTG